MGVSLSALAAAIENGGTYIEPKTRRLADVVRDAGIPDCCNRFLPENEHMNRRGPAASIKNVPPARKTDTTEFDAKNGATHGKIPEKVGRVAPAAPPATATTSTPEPTATPEANTQETTMRKSATATKTTAKKSAPKSTARRAAPAKKANAARGDKPESKADIIERMLKSKNGTTRKSLSEATDYPYVNLTMAAKRAGEGFKLVEADGRVALVPVEPKK